MVCSRTVVFNNLRITWRYHRQKEFHVQAENMGMHRQSKFWRTHRSIMQNSKSSRTRRCPTDAGSGSDTSAALTLRHHFVVMSTLSRSWRMMMMLVMVALLQTKAMSLQVAQVTVWWWLCPSRQPVEPVGPPPVCTCCSRKLNEGSSLSFHQHQIMLHCISAVCTILIFSFKWKALKV